MAIAGNEAIAMVDFDEVAIAVDPAGHGDFTGRRRPDRRPVVDADVDASWKPEPPPIGLPR